MKLIKTHGSIEVIFENTKTKYDYPENYLDIFNDAKKNFKIFIDNINVDDIDIHKSERNLEELSNFPYWKYRNERKTCSKFFKKIP